MLLKLFFITVTGIFLSGCASGLKREVRQLESEIQQSQSVIDQAKASLADNPDVYDGQNCLEPERGQRPKPGRVGNAFLPTRNNAVMHVVGTVAWRNNSVMPLVGKTACPPYICWLLL